jgi:HEAT repeat protein
VIRTFLISTATMLALAPAAGHIGIEDGARQTRGVRELVSDLTAADAVARTRAACDLRALGNAAADAIAPLIAMLGDPAPVESSVCGRHSWGNGSDNLTTPGKQAAAALVAIGTKAFQPVMGALRSQTWTARENAAWALGAFDDQRAVPALVDTLRDPEPAVREQAAWALGALDDATAVPALTTALKDADPRVRRQSAWALGAIDDARATDALAGALSDPDDRTREQAAWALGAIDDNSALPAIIPAL